MGGEFLIDAGPRPVRVTPPLLDELQSIVGERLTTSAAVREQHGRDESYAPAVPPEAVVFANTTEEVSAVVAACARHGSPIVPFGTGTSLEGHIAAVEGGVCIDLTGMSRIVAVHAEDLDAVVEAGVTRKQLNAHLRDTGLFFPVDPGADASLGGMASTRASGTNAVRYGTMRENVVALTAVLADGRVIRSGGRARKSSTGYDLCHLFVGAEGTLGVVTELTLRLHPIPQAIAAATVPFPDVDTAVRSVVETIQSAVPMARIEFLDEVQMEAVRRYSKLDAPAQPTLFLEFHGSEASVREQAETVEAICDDNGGGAFHWSLRPEDRERLWAARHNAYYAGIALKPGCKPWTTDVCVPISRLTECIVETRRDIDDSAITATIVGHVGDGNFHVLMLIDRNRDAELDAARRINDRLVKRALAMEGTCSGEHGIGLGKRAYMKAEHGEGVGVMRAVKQALDPQNLMNPGKILPD